MKNNLKTILTLSIAMLIVGASSALASVSEKAPSLYSSSKTVSSKNVSSNTYSSYYLNRSGLPNGTLGQTLRYDGSRWVANSYLWNSGNSIGIGTTNPRAILEINGEYEPAKLIISSPGGEDSSLDLYSNDSAKVSLFYEGNDHVAYIKTFNSVEGGIPLFFQTNSTNRMVIDGTTGNIGIATLPSLTEKLNVNGSVLIHGNSNFIGSIKTNGLDAVSEEYFFPSLDGGTCSMVYTNGLLTSSTCSTSGKTSSYSSMK